MVGGRRLKRKLLRQAIAHNLETPEERRRRRTRRRHGRRMPRGTVALLVVAAGIPLAQHLLSLPPRGAEPPASPAAPGPRPATATAGLEDARVFPAPRPIRPEVFPLAVRRIVLDPGHGGDDRGTVAGEGSVEKDLTLDIARRLRDRLEAAGFEVLLTRESDRTVSLKERAELANARHADLFLSIHVNWIAAREVRGVETYFLGTTEDPELSELARRENRDSGYTLASLRSLLEGIYADVRKDESRSFAAAVQRSLHRSLLTVNPRLQNRGVKTAPFVVLVATEMPAVLAEVSCLSNREEAEMLALPRYREHIAEALFRGIESYARDVNQTG